MGISQRGAYTQKMNRWCASKPTMLFGVAVIFLLVLGGCGAGGQSQAVFEVSAVEAGISSTAPADQYKIALVMKTLTNPFFIEMEKGARKAQAELGVHLIVKTGAQETSINQQIAIVEEMIAEKVDAIVIAPGSSTELVPVLKNAQDAGIVVVNIDNRLDPVLSEQLGLKNVPFISVDNEQGAYLSAKCIADRFNAPGRVAILEGIREAKNAQDRKAGAERAFGENPFISIAASETAYWKIDEAHDVMQRILQTFPDIQGIFAANDMMALGAIKYLEEAGHDKIMVSGYDALGEAVAAVGDGKMLCTIDQQAAEQGYLGIQYAVRALKGESLPAETMVDVLLVSRPDAH